VLPTISSDSEQAASYKPEDANPPVLHSFAINKLLNFHETFIKPVSHAILTAYPPLATNHHGVQFVEFVISSNRILQRNNIVKYIESLCSQKDG
jgi:hypothetical protein